MSNLRFRFSFRSTLQAAVLIYGISLAFRLYYVFSVSGPLADEGIDTYAGIIYSSNLLEGKFASSFFQYNYEHPAFAKLIFGFFTKVLSPLDLGWLGQSGVPWVSFSDIMKARIGAAVTTSLAPVILFVFVRDISRDLAAWAASIVLATYPYYAFYGALAYLDVICSMFMLASLWMFFKSNDKAHAHFIFSGIFAGLSVASKYPGILTIAVILLLLVLKWIGRNGRAAWRKDLEGVGIVLLCGLITFYLVNPIVWTDPSMLVKSLLYHQGRFGVGDPARPPYLPLLWIARRTPPIAFLGFLAGFLCIASRKQFSPSTQLHRFLFPAYLLVTITFLVINTDKAENYFTIAVPPIAAIAGIGISKISDRLSRRLTESSRGAIHLSPRMITALLLTLNFIVALLIITLNMIPYLQRFIP